MSARDWQKNDIQWWRAKGSDTFGPCGPFIATGLDYGNLDMQVRVNGKVKMKTNTKLMVHDIPTTVSFLSKHVTLHPGDLIFTGTAGKTAADPVGDVVEVELQGVGVLRNKVAAGSRGGRLTEQEQHVPRRGLLELAAELVELAGLAATPDENADEPDRLRRVGGADLDGDPRFERGSDGDAQSAGGAIEHEPLADSIAEGRRGQHDANHRPLAANRAAAIGIGVLGRLPLEHFSSVNGLWSDDPDRFSAAAARRSICVSRRCRVRMQTIVRAMIATEPPITIERLAIAHVDALSMISEIDMKALPAPRHSAGSTGTLAHPAEKPEERAHFARIVEARPQSRE